MTASPVPAAPADPPELAAPALFVPVTIEAMTVTLPAVAKWSWTPPAYRGLPFFEPTDPLPFTPASYRPDGKDFTGIILHWALPDGITQGGQSGPGAEVSYPAIPNRWLLTRKFRDPQDPTRWAFWSIVIACDYVWDPASENPAGSLYPTQDGRRWQFLGRTWPLAAWPGEKAIEPYLLKPRLTAVGPGDATFAAFAPNVRDVLAVADPLTGVGEGPVSYALYGWYGDPASDPLYGATAYGPQGWQTRKQWHDLMAAMRWLPDTCEAGLHRAVRAAADWAAHHLRIVDPNRPRTQYPARTLCHGMVADVAWFGPYGPTFSGVPTTNPAQAGYVKPRIAIGNSSADALAALIGAVIGDAAGREAADGEASSAEAGGSGPGDIGQELTDVMAAFQAGLLPELVQADGQARVEAGLQAGWFNAVPGGTTWRVVAPEVPQDPAGREAPPPLSPEQAALLIELNRRQAALDQRLRLLASAQSEVSVLWWEQKFIDANEPDYDKWKQLVKDADARARPATLALVGECRWLRQQRDTCLIALTDTLDGLRLSAEPGPVFSRPNEPVLLISGARRAFKHGEDGVFEEGRLACRFTGQAVSGLEVTVGGREYVVQGAQLPGPVLAGLDFPAELADLAVEAMVLDISNAPLIASVADPADPWPLLGAIRRVQSGAWNPALNPILDRQVIVPGDRLLTQYGLGAIPSKIAVQFWSPPWSPLYLDWRIVYHPSAALTGGRFRDWAPPADAPVPGPDDWSYRWLGSEPGPDQVRIEGRTLLTPQSQTALAAQLERVIRDAGSDPGLRPYLWALRDAQDYLVASDLLCQAISGFGAALLQQIPATFRVAPGAELAPYLDPGGVPRFVPASRAATEATAAQFGPLRAGHFRLDDLWVVDDFGQAFLVFEAIRQKPRDYHPVRSPDMVTPDWPTYAMLRPRITQFGRLELPLLSAERDDREVDPQAPAGATPLCGWLLANPLEHGILVYHADGTLAGELARGGDGVVWWPAPETAPPPHGGPGDVQISNRHLRGIVIGLLRHRDPAGALDEFLALLSDGALATGPDGSWIDEELPVPAGRPLTVIRARVRYLLSGEPAYSQRWPDTGQRLTGGFERARLPVQLGSTELLDDGVIGCYLNDDYRQVQSVYAPPDPGPSGYVGRQRPDPALGDAGGTLLTMIVTPHGTVHAVTGLLPVLELTVPAPLTTPALRRMAVTLRTGPVLGDGTGTVLPLPATADSAWSWLQYTDTVRVANEYPAEPADATARLPDAAPVLREGWLKLLTGQRPTRFRYAVSPRAVPCTTDPELPSSATFEITIYNGSPDPVLAKALVFQVPIGTSERDLTEHPGTITVIAPKGWSVAADGGRLVATPASQAPVQAGDVLIFVVGGVQVVTEPGIAVIRVTEITDEDRIALIAVSKIGNQQGSAMFSYTITPDAVPRTVNPDEPSKVTLMITVTNKTGHDVEVRRLVFTIDAGDGPRNLTDAANLGRIRPQAGAGTRWDFHTSGDGRFLAYPDSPFAGLPAGDSISFILSEVIVNSAIGHAEIKVTESTDSPAETTIQVAKQEPGLAITEFLASPVQLTPGQKTVLTWVTTGASRRTLTIEHDGTFPVDAEGSREEEPVETTRYTLSAEGNGRTIQQQVTVTVATVHIVDFSARPKQLVKGDPTTFRWVVTGPESCSLDPGGIELEPPEVGSYSMPIDVSDRYTLTAQGYGRTDTRSVPVTVMPTAISSFTAEPRIVPPGTDVTLRWKAEWMSGFRVDPPGELLGREFTKTTDRPGQTTTYRLTALGLNPQVREVTVAVGAVIARLGLTANAAKPDEMVLAWKVECGSAVLEVWTGLGSAPGDPSPVPADGDQVIPLTRGQVTNVRLAALGSGGPAVATLKVAGTLAVGSTVLESLAMASPSGITSERSVIDVSWKSAQGVLTGLIEDKHSSKHLRDPVGETDLRLGSRVARWPLWTGDIYLRPVSADLAGTGAAADHRAEPLAAWAARMLAADHVGLRWDIS